MRKDEARVLDANQILNQRRRTQVNVARKIIAAGIQVGPLGPYIADDVVQEALEKALEAGKDLAVKRLDDPSDSANQLRGLRQPSDGFTIDQRNKIMRVREQLWEIGLPTLARYFEGAVTLRVPPTDLAGWFRRAADIIDEEYK